MRQLRRHPCVVSDIEDALAFSMSRFGPKQAAKYAQLIDSTVSTLLAMPTVGRLRPDLGADIRLMAISNVGGRAAHGFIYRIAADGAVELLRLAHMARDLPKLLPEGPLENL